MPIGLDTHFVHLKVKRNSVLVLAQLSITRYEGVPWKSRHIPPGHSIEHLVGFGHATTRRVEPQQFRRQSFVLAQEVRRDQPVDADSLVEGSHAVACLEKGGISFRINHYAIVYGGF